MQTFLPFPDVLKSVRCLDYRRLGKQRVEAGQLITAIRSRGGGWYKHPATQMWLRYVDFLEFYKSKCIEEWVLRGFKNTMEQMTPFPNEESIPKNLVPWWYGNNDFHLSHQSNLLRKDQEHYSKYFPDVDPYLPYVWPSAYPV